ncbi:MAG: hypothetical protein ACLP74_08005 [Thermoplasmata archaeon]
MTGITAKLGEAIPPVMDCGARGRLDLDWDDTDLVYGLGPERGKHQKDVGTTRVMPLRLLVDEERVPRPVGRKRPLDQRLD